jgi:actin related protein 2/3 complex subunit 2
MSRGVAGKILLESENQIVKRTLAPRILEDVREPCEVSVADFDDTSLKVSVGEDLTTATVSINIRDIDTLRENGTEDLVNAVYPGMQIAPEAGFSLSVQANLDDINGDEGMLFALADLKRNVLGGPIHRALSALKAGNSGSVPSCRIHYRENEWIYVCPAADRVVVIISVDMIDDTDRAFTRVFLQAFADSQRSVTGAPPTAFSREPPGELSSIPTDESGDIAGYISFTFEARHVSNEAVMEKIVTMLAGFRAYLLYHIKATKTYLHMRMRKRVNSWLQILNRAVPEVESTEKKTASGKTFKRNF